MSKELTIKINKVYSNMVDLRMQGLYALNVKEVRR